MRILVTGGSGYLGTHIRKFFNADDLSRRAGMDILNSSDAAVAADYDVVIHTAACLDKAPDNADAVFETNVIGTKNLLKVMRKDSIFILLSTKDIYGRFADTFKEVPETCPAIYSGQSALEWSKLIAERYVDFYSELKGFRSCIFRLSTVYAPPSGDNIPNIVGSYADAINSGETIAFPAKGIPIRDYLHVDDLSAACQAFIDSIVRHGTYNLGGGKANAVTLRDLVINMERVSGLQAVIDTDTDLPAPVPMNYISDLTLVGQELDWSPKISLDEGLKSLFR